MLSDWRCWALRVLWFDGLLSYDWLRGQWSIQMWLFMAFYPHGGTHSDRTRISCGHRNVIQYSMDDDSSVTPSSIVEEIRNMTPPSLAAYTAYRDGRDNKVGARNTDAFVKSVSRFWRR
jgi:hypothetical protein